MRMMNAEFKLCTMYMQFRLEHLYLSLPEHLYLSLPDEFFLRDRARHLVLRLVRVHLGERGGGADLKRVLVVHLQTDI